MGGLYQWVPRSVLAFYAHPDDADVSCGGTLATWSTLGTVVSLVVCAQGEKGSRDKNVNPLQLKKLREKELEAAIEYTGVANLYSLAIPDGEIENTYLLREKIVGLIRLLRPDAVLCPDPTAVFFGSGYFNHRDHRELGWAVLDAVSPASSSPHYFPSQGDPHQVSTVLLSGSLDPDIAVDISMAIDRKLQAVLCHESQIEDRVSLMREVIIGRAQETGRGFNVDFAEAFKLLDLGG